MSTHEVNVGDVESELEKIWCGPNHQGEIRACLFNLIVYAHDKRRIAYLSKVAHSIIGKFPCRVIVIQGHQENFPNVQVRVSNEVTDHGGQKIACDELLVDVGVDQLDTVPNLIIPHIVADLPIYLLWGQNPTSDNEILPYLEKYATKLIFDSECTSNLQRFSKGMLVLMDATNAEIMDLNWANISGWRDIMASLFDTKEHIEKLQQTEKVNIKFNSVEMEHIRNHEIRAIYFQAWLASRLGWEYSSIEAKEESIKILYDGSKREITLVGEINDKLEPGAIFSIEIEANHHHYTFLRHPSLPKVTAHISTADRCELPMTLPFPDLHRSSVFMQEVFYQSATTHYRKMLETILPIAWEEK